MWKGGFSLLTLLGIVASGVPAIPSAGTAPTKSADNGVKEDWDFYLLRVDDQPASIALNLALARQGPISAQPSMAYVRVKMRQPRPDGLSSSEEFETLSALGDELLASVSQAGRTTYAGRNTSGGNRDFYFYTAEPTAFAEAVKKAMNLRPAYQFEIGGRLDPDWKVYFEFLYPSPDDLQRILNRRVSDSLADNGDDLSKPRMIDHMAYLPNKAAADALADYLRKQGFAVRQPQVDGGEVGLGFERINTPKQMDETVIPIARYVRELGGAYDGWGCEVTN